MAQRPPAPPTSMLLSGSTHWPWKVETTQVTRLQSLELPGPQEALGLAS